MRSSLVLLLLSGVISGSAALLPVLARDLEADPVRDSLDLVLNQPLPDGTASETSVSNDSQDPASAAQELPSEPAPAPVKAQPPAPPAPVVVSVSTGEASWYGPGFFGNRTANGEVFRPGTMTAAHRTLPFGTRVRVTNLWNGRSTVVRINDRGPFHGARVIDLAHGAANQLGLIASGVAKVKLEVLR